LFRYLDLQARSLEVTDFYRRVEKLWAESDSKKRAKNGNAPPPSDPDEPDELDDPDKPTKP